MFEATLAYFEVKELLFIIIVMLVGLVIGLIKWTEEESRKTDQIQDDINVILHKIDK